MRLAITVTLSGAVNAQVGLWITQHGCRNVTRRSLLRAPRVNRKRVSVFTAGSVMCVAWHYVSVGVGEILLAGAVSLWTVSSAMKRRRTRRMSGSTD